MKRPILVGIDPGLVTGVAILDLRSQLVALMSRKGLKKGDMIKYILRFGDPILLASDVNPPPKLVKSLSIALGSKLWYPSKSFHVKEKVKLLRGLIDLPQDVHQRDALTAALAAYRSHGELLARVRQVLRKRGLNELFEGVVYKLLKGESASVDEAVRDLLGERQREREELERLRRDYKSLQRLLARREEEIRRLKEYVEKLKLRLRFL